MSKNLVKIVYTGPYPKMKVWGMGIFLYDIEKKVGIPHDVSEETAVKLLRIKGFKRFEKLIKKPIKAEVKK